MPYTAPALHALYLTQGKPCMRELAAGFMPFALRCLTKSLHHMLHMTLPHRSGVGRGKLPRTLKDAASVLQKT